ncbi:MAG: NAD-dependent epimerase/dehydratase family protein [Thermoflexales bacterium]|nr:NAD-dependent epimerase/dehydratase family protein [Thermoflexales bacterium]
MPSSLVTGGAGFIGSHVAQELLTAGHQVIVVDDLSGGNADNVPAGAQLEIASILDRDKIQALFDRHHFDYVFHLAAYAAEGLSHFIKHFNYQNNLIGSVNLINAAVNYELKCFVFTSSIAVYGATPPPMREDVPPRPEDSYGIAKFAVEMELAATKLMFGLDYIIFRPHNVYGEQQNIGDKYRNVIGIFMNQIMHGQPMTIFGDGSQTRAFSYIADVAPLIARSIQVPAARNEIFNIGADTPYTVNHLAQAVAQAMGVEPELAHLPARTEVKHAYSSHDKLERVFGKRSPVPLEEGLGRMATWARQVGARQSRPFDAIEIPKNLPPSWQQT